MYEWSLPLKPTLNIIGLNSAANIKQTLTVATNSTCEPQPKVNSLFSEPQKKYHVRKIRCKWSLNLFQKRLWHLKKTFKFGKMTWYTQNSKSKEQQKSS